jgi:YVTN family beta-propeller protein
MDNPFATGKIYLGSDRNVKIDLFMRWGKRVNTWFLAVVLFSSTAPAQNSYVNFEGKQTNPIRLSPDGTRLFAVNTPDARLSVFDVTHPSNPFLIAEIPVGVEPVSVNPRDSNEVWVVNEVSDSVSVVSVSQRMVTDTLYVKDEPADVVFAGGKAFVSEARNNQIAVFNLTNHILLTNLPVFGENPRALAVSPNGTKIYAAFALSGNHTTIIPTTNAPAQITNAPPISPGLPAPPPVALIVDATNSTYYPSLIKYTMPDNDVVEIDVATMTISRYFPHVGTVNLGLAVNPASGELYVANTEARNLVHFEPNVRGHAVDNRITRIAIGTGAVAPFDLNSNINYSLFPNLPAQTNALAQPTAVVFDPGGSFFYVAAFGSDRVARVDTNGNVLARIDVGPATAFGSAADPRNKRGPRGLALNAGAQRLYVLNRLANTITIIDTSADAVINEIPVGSYDPTPAVIRYGRGFLYDAKLSGNGTMSCASCHVDAEMDLLAWDLGDPQGQMGTNKNVAVAGTTSFSFVTNSGPVHPMKGPMTTQTLRGLNTLDPLHWRGDRTNFLQFNGAFSSLMGGSTLADTNMAAYRDYINTIAFEPNPNQNLDRALPATFAGANPVAGRNAFTSTNYTTSGLTCISCHPFPEGTTRFILSKTALSESQDIKVPQLRDLYQRTHFNQTHGSPAAGTNSLDGFGFTHDGTFEDNFAFLSVPTLFQLFASDPVVKSNLQAFMLCFDTGTAPAVGYSRTAAAPNVNTASLSNDWSLLEGQAAATNVDLIARGTIDGQAHGLLFQPAAGTYLPDTTNLAPLARAQLAAKIQAGDTLTLMGVPPGLGTRMGIARNGAATLDADLPPPGLHILRTNGMSVVHWPFSAAGFTLQSSTNLAPATWTNMTDPVDIIGDQNSVTLPPAGGIQFYRLIFVQ